MVNLMGCVSLNMSLRLRLDLHRCGSMLASRRNDNHKRDHDTVGYAVSYRYQSPRTMSPLPQFLMTVMTGTGSRCSACMLV